mgnify:CR=1 FL=1
MTVDPATTTISIPQALCAPALRGKEARHLRTWALLLRVVVSEGTGRVTRDQAVRGLRALGLGKSAANEWINSLVASRYARLAIRKPTGEPVIVLTSIARLHASYGVSDRGDRVAVPVAPLIHGKAFCHVFGLAAGAVHNDLPLSRATRADLYGISPSTQRRAERRFGASVQRQYVEYECHQLIDPGKLPAIDNRRVFVHDGKIYERRPSVVRTPFEFHRGHRCRHSADHQATAELTSPMPSRQTFKSERAARKHMRKHGIRPSSGWRNVNPDDSRLFAREGEQQLFGELVLIVRCVAWLTLGCPPSDIR